MAMTLAEHWEIQKRIDEPYATRWQSWYESLSAEQRAEWLTGNDLGAVPAPPEPPRYYLQALLDHLLRDRHKMLVLPWENV